MLNEWAARDLQASVGDAVTLDYYLWEDPGRLVTRTADFRIAGIVPIAAGDRDMAPSYPGITDSPTLEGWDPPFPLDLRRVRRVDEDYWQQYRTTPKAFIPLEVGQQLWRSRYGGLTSIRIVPQPDEPFEQAADSFARRLQARIDPLATGLAIRNVRGEALTASRGATTSASTSSTSVSSSWCRHSCSRRSSSSLASSSARGKSACFERSASGPEQFAGCS